LIIIQKKRPAKKGPEALPAVFSAFIFSGELMMRKMAGKKRKNFVKLMITGYQNWR
jgi:hypothetical protein